MDLYGYMISRDPYVSKYLTEHYGPIPRLRGVRFMKIERAIFSPNDEVYRTFCGQDVIAIHTRCGGGYYDVETWEHQHPLFLVSQDDAFDETYRDSYFSAVVNDEYYQLLNRIENDEIEEVK